MRERSRGSLSEGCTGGAGIAAKIESPSAAGVSAIIMSKPVMFSTLTTPDAPVSSCAIVETLRRDVPAELSPIADLFLWLRFPPMVKCDAAEVAGEPLRAEGATVGAEDVPVG